MQDRLNRHRSIARHIIDGTLTIDSVSEFKNMLSVFPDNPALHASFADLLARKKSFKAAAGVYAKAAELSLAHQKILPAVLVKIMQWRIEKPSHEQARQFFNAVLNCEDPSSPLNVFFRSLSYAEFIALTNRVARVRLPSGRMIKKIGDVENALYFVATGALCDTIYRPLKPNETSQKKQKVYLSEDDILGDVLPLDSEKISQSYTETISGVELARISKQRLSEVCAKYPHFAEGLKILVESSDKKVKANPERGVRRTERHPLPIRMNLEIDPDGAEATPLVLQGFSRDISVGGVCVVVDSKYANISRALNALSKSGIQVCFKGDAISLNVAGSVVWSREVSYERQKTLALGIQFKEMTPRMRGMLVVFAEMLYGN